MIKTFLISLTFCCLALSGCKTYHHISTSLGAPIDYEKNITEAIRNTNFPEHLLIENADFQLKGEDNGNAKITVYIERDQRFFFSVKYLGFEIARGEISADSIKFINRFQREYYFGRINDLKNYLPLEVDFYTLQHFLYSGFYYRNEKRKDYLQRFEKVNNQISFSEIINAGQKIQLFYDPVYTKLDKIYLSDYVHNMTAEIRITRKDLKPDVIFINYMKGKNGHEMEINVKDIKEKEYNKTDFKVSKNYKQLERLF